MSQDPRHQPPLYGPGVKNRLFPTPCPGIKCRVGGPEHGQLTPPRSPKPLYPDSQPEVVGCRKSRCKEGIRIRATAGSGSDHPASKENGRKHRATVRPVGVGTLSNREPQRNRPPVRLPLFCPHQRLRRPNPERRPTRTRLTRPVGGKAPTHSPDGPGLASIRTLKGAAARSYPT